MTSTPGLLSHKPTTPQSKEEKRAKEDEIRKHHDFYTYKLNKEGQLEKITIKKAKLVDKLLGYNFYRHDIDSETSRYVHVVENRVKEVNREAIIDRFFKELKVLPDREEISIRHVEQGEVQIPIKITPEILRQTLYENIAEYFSKSLLNRLVPPKKIEIKMDSKAEKFFYYKNGFVVCSATGFQLLPYDQLDKYIWDNQKLDRDFKQDNNKGDFEKFIERVCGHSGNLEMKPDVKKRFQAFKTLIGYNLHGYFNCKLYATILTDSRFSDDDEANGRTGKTLFTKALGQMLNYDKDSKVYTELNGKDFNKQNKHRYEACSMETQLVSINDLGRGTPIEMFFNDITEGITVDKKNEKPFRILAKIIISTNKTLRIDGESAKDRTIQFEFSDYYTADRSPATEFGKWFFSEWTETDWNQFDTFMVKCVVEYMKHGVIKAETINLRRRMLIDSTAPEFVSWMDDLIVTGKFNPGGQTDMFTDNTVIFEYGRKMDKKKLFTAFILAYPNDHRNRKQRTFTDWLRLYIKHNDDLVPLKKDVTEGRSNGMDWIIFKHKDDAKNYKETQENS